MLTFADSYSRAREDYEKKQPSFFKQKLNDFFKKKLNKKQFDKEITVDKTQSLNR
ncbi:hypothetical protein [Helicobacter monodelphidis]|uniref:hypothetical protein n=1 Tax=Helicobacter sp. 15-1451 TaxID=2004995 RepID=UPI0015EBBB7E|nr:hypothetical protein [Helicobacter sp. 15-1451]